MKFKFTLLGWTPMRVCWIWQREMGPSSISVTPGIAMHIFKKNTHTKTQSFIFPTSPWLHYSTTADINHSKLDLHWAIWAACLSPILCINLQNGKRRNKTPRYTHLAKEAKHGPIQFFCLVLWFSLPERAPALGFIHCVGLKSLVYIQIPMCSFSLLLLPSLRHHPESLRLSPRRKLL